MPLQDICTQLVGHSIATSTKQLYSRIWDNFVSFCQTCSPPVQALPAGLGSAAAFLAFQFQNGKAGSTITSYASAIAFVHKINTLPDPTEAFVIRKMLKGARNASTSEDTRLPISMQLLHQLCSATVLLFNKHYISTLYTAMFLLAFHGFARVGELAVTGSSPVHTLNIQDITLIPNRVVKVTFRHFKHSNGRTFELSIYPTSTNHCPVKSMQQYLSIRPPLQGPLFLLPSGEPVSKSNFSSALSNTIKFLNLPAASYKSHSFRIGAATYSAIQGYSDQQIRLMGRWRSNAFLKYIRVSSF